MTREQWKERLPLIEAFARGECVQMCSKYCRSWEAHEELTFTDPIEAYRVAPKPKLRPWKPEEVQISAWFRSKAQPDVWMSLCGVRIGDGCLKVTLGQGWEDALEKLEHSTDNGKTWLPCGVLE